GRGPSRRSGCAPAAEGCGAPSPPAGRPAARRARTAPRPAVRLPGRRAPRPRSAPRPAPSRRCSPSPPSPWTGPRWSRRRVRIIGHRGPGRRGRGPGVRPPSGPFRRGGPRLRRRRRAGRALASPARSGAAPGVRPRPARVHARHRPGRAVAGPLPGPPGPGGAPVPTRNPSPPITRARGTHRPVAGAPGSAPAWQDRGVTEQLRRPFSEPGFWAGRFLDQYADGRYADEPPGGGTGADGGEPDRTVAEYDLGGGYALLVRAGRAVTQELSHQITERLVTLGISARTYW